MPERPLECSECKKAVHYHYTELVGKNRTEIIMCKDCPVLQKKLKDVDVEGSDGAFTITQESLGLSCSNCSTSLDVVRMGHPLGCSECYEIFADVIIDEMKNSSLLPQELISQPISSASKLHLGREPGEMTELSESFRLLALNEALEETLAREDYEQAAWIRDQIKEITKSTNGKK
jgi:protein arginine kinase activator